MALRTNKSGLTYWVTRPQQDADCRDCPWEPTSSNAMAQSAQHHRSTGHTVHVVEERAVIYQTPESYKQEREEMEASRRRYKERHGAN